MAKCYMPFFSLIMTLVFLLFELMHASHLHWHASFLAELALVPFLFFELMPSMKPWTKERAEELTSMQLPAAS